MATCTWSGASSNLWNVAGNWDTLPSAGDDLVFPLTASNKSNSNDFAADTAFNSITIQGTGYTLAGNRITLGAGGITQTTGTNTISLAIVLGAAVTVNVEGTTLTLSGIVSDGAGSAVAKTGAAQLALSGANTFTSGLTVKAGTLEGYLSNSCFGGSGFGVITIGDSVGSSDATLYLNNRVISNPIQTGSSTGILRLSGISAQTYNGAIFLSNHLTITNGSNSFACIIAGGITGTGNVILEATKAGWFDISNEPINHTGTITNSGTGTGTTTISAVIGTNVTGVIQNSATSQLTLSGANTFTSGLTIKAGVCEGKTNASAFGAGNINLGDATGSASATILAGNNLTYANPIVLVSGSTGDRVIATTFWAPTFSGGVTGTGDIHLRTSSSGNLTVQSLNNVGAVINSGTGSALVILNNVVGTNVTAVRQSSATSAMYLVNIGTIANCSDKFVIISGAIRLGSVQTVANLFVDATGCADGTAQFVLVSNQVVTAEAKFLGAAGKQLLVTSDGLGTARTITVTGATLSNITNVDFRDITFANGGSDVDLSARITGDCGGNTISGGGTLSFTTADDWFWYSAAGGTYNLSDRTYWFTATAGGGTQMGADRGPLPQDMLYVDSSSINGATTIDQDMPRMPGIDFTGCDAVEFHMDNVVQAVYGSLIGSANVTVRGTSNMFVLFQSRSAVVLSWASGQNTNMYIGAVTGSVVLAGDFRIDPSRTLYLSSGSFNAGVYDLSLGQFALESIASKTLAMGSGTWNIAAQFISAGGLTSTSIGGTSTIVLGVPNSVANRTFFGGYTFHNLSIVANTTGTQQITVLGHNTFTGTLTVNGPKTVKFTAGTTQTIAAFATTGTGVVLQSTSAGSPWYLVDPSGTNQVSNATIIDSYVYGYGDTPAGGALFYANTNVGNVDGGGNEPHNGATNRGWRFTPIDAVGYTYGDNDPDFVLTTADGAGNYVPIADSDTVDGGVEYGVNEEGTGVNVTTILTALGLASGNLDTQLSDISTIAGGAKTAAEAVQGKLPAGGANMHAAGAAVAKSPATLDWVADVTNKPTIGTSTLTQEQVQTAATAAIVAYDPPTFAEMESRTLPNDVYLQYDTFLGYIQLICRKDVAIANDRDLWLEAINANEGSGIGAFDNATDSEQAIRDNQQTSTDAILTELETLSAHGDSAWRTATGFAPADTALSNIIWTDVKAGYIDAEITSRHASGAAVAKSPATLDASDVSGNLPVDTNEIIKAIRPTRTVLGPCIKPVRAYIKPI